MFTGNKKFTTLIFIKTHTRTSLITITARGYMYVLL